MSNEVGKNQSLVILFQPEGIRAQNSGGVSYDLTVPCRSRKLAGAMLEAGQAKVVLNLGLKGEWHCRGTPS